MHRTIQRSAILLLSVITTLLIVNLGTTHAYSTQPGPKRWPQTTKSKTYYVQTNLWSLLGLPSSQQTTIINAISNARNQWNISSRMTFVRDPGGSSLPRYWTAGYINSSSTAAHVIFNPGTDEAYTVFNTHPAFTWYLNGTHGPRPGGGWNTDVYKVSLHEWGHWFSLQDYPSYTWLQTTGGTQANAMMWYDPHGSKTSLFTDDKAGATMIYGISTSFEVSQFLGLLNASGQNPVPMPANNVAAYAATCTAASSGNPDYWTYNAGTDGISASPGGGRFMRFRGCARSASLQARAYMFLASSTHDSSGHQGSACAANCYQKIQPGMSLQWLQRNQEGCAAIISLRFTDGTYLHDYPAVADTSSRTVVPYLRCQYYPAGGGWYSVRVNIGEYSALIGKTIDRYLVVYDNGATPKIEKWRIYFDDVRIVY